MSYGMAAALQAAIFARLSALPALAGVPVLDAVPTGQRAGTFMSDRGRGRAGPVGQDGRRGRASLAISVVSDAAGFLAAKDSGGGDVGRAGRGAAALSRGRVVGDLVPAGAWRGGWTRATCGGST